MDSATLTATIVALLTSLAGGGVLAAILTRKGQAEDNKLANREQAFDQMQTLATERLQEIKDLRAEKATERAEHEHRMELARAEFDRRIKSLEERLDRQYARCRRITEAFVSAISAKSPDAANVAEQAAKQHFFDHDWGAGDHPPPSDGARGERT